MKVAVNLMPFSIGGGMTYALNFLEYLGEHTDEFEFHLISNRGFIDKDKLNKAIKLKEVSIPWNSGYLRILYEQFVIPIILLNWKADVYFSPTDNIPLLTGCPSVMAMRNLNLYVDNNPVKSIAGKFRYLLLRSLAELSAKRASSVIFVSETSREITEEKIPALKGKSHVIYHGVSRKLPECSDSFKPGYPYILIIATVYPHKNILNAVKAFSILVNKKKIKHRLIIVGKIENREYYQIIIDFIMKEKLSDKIVFTGMISYESIWSYYKGAEIMIFPSLFETFGHPLVEAMASGTPVAASDIEVAHEVLGSAGVFFNPEDPEQIAEKIFNVIDNKILRREMVKNGYTRAEKFDWAKTVEETLALIRKEKG